MIPLDLGCVIAKDRRRRGYATEASRAVLEAAFAAGYTSVTAMTEPTNTAALGALDRLGLYTLYVLEQPVETLA
ncbi:MAG TPA: GNAT family N-acetyltransferase [Gaiellaceae bacterium]|nr:GNAT family N-acetyltransferase [Gaiellaceae bacterium]